MFTDDASHVIHAAVANLDGVAVENLVQDTRYGEVLANYVQEFASDVCPNVFTEGRVVPDHISLAFSLRVCGVGWLFWDVRKLLLKWLRLRSLLYSSAADSKTVRSDEVDETCSLII